MKPWVVAALCLALGAPAPAAVVDLEASELRGNGLEVHDLGPGLLGLDPNFTNAEPIDLVIFLEVEDGSSIEWNALVDNLTGEAWRGFLVEATDADLGVGSARANGGSVASIDAGAASAVLAFDPLESAGLDLGAPFGSGQNWTLTPLLRGPMKLRLTAVPVPEPGALALVSLGLASLAARGRRRRAGP